MTTVTVRHFTDPACPFAFSAEPRLRALEWRYGDQLEWELRMVVLSERPDELTEAGLTPEILATGLRKLGTQHGMPIDWSERERMAASAPACRAVVAARVHAGPREANALLRRFRTLTMGGALLDDPGLPGRAASAAGIDPEALDRWTEDEAVTAALSQDRAEARTPSPAARALDHKLGGPAQERRYTCPSLELRNGREAEPVAVPGFQPLESYEAALANLAPALLRRPDPESAAEVLAWAPFPLATAEIAMVCGSEPEDVRTELARGDARFEPVGADGYWSAA